MIDYKKIEEVNKRLCPVDIKGKAYNTVNQRVMAFRELFEEGKIVTTLISDENGKAIFKADIYDGDKIIATGHAFENQEDRSSFVNKTSYIENCETSAVGRALAFLGIGATESIASAEEVNSAIMQQEAEKRYTELRNKPATENNIALVKQLLEETESDVEKFCDWLDVKDIDSMNTEQYVKAVKALSKKKENKHE